MTSLVSARIAMSACWTPGWLIDAEVQSQLVECPVSRHFATVVERPIGGRSEAVLGLFRTGRRPRHLLHNGRCRNRYRVADARTRRYVKRQPHNIRDQVCDRDDQQNQANANALRHVLLLPLQAT
jgi:hypothetical protein